MKAWLENVNYQWMNLGHRTKRRTTTLKAFQTGVKFAGNKRHDRGTVFNDWMDSIHREMKFRIKRMLSASEQHLRAVKRRFQKRCLDQERSSEIRNSKVSGIYIRSKDSRITKSDEWRDNTLIFSSNKKYWVLRGVKVIFNWAAKKKTSWKSFSMILFELQ